MSAVAVADVAEPEAPVCLADGGFYLVEMSRDRRRVTHVGASGERRVVAIMTGRPNGLALDGDGCLWVAEAGAPAALVRIASDGTRLASLEAVDGGMPFLWPNDLAFAGSGLLYMTDSGILERNFLDDAGVRTDFATLPYDGRVYEIDPRGPRVLRTLDRGLRFANGIAIGPDDRLYVAETLTGDILAYDLEKPAPVRRRFGNCCAPADPPRPEGPDGMKFGADGCLYCTVYGRGTIAVLDRDGVVVEEITTRGRKPTNIAFRPGRHDALVTEVENGEVEIIRMAVEGQLLHEPRIY